jgi:hypothetical protein
MLRVDLDRRMQWIPGLQPLSRESNGKEWRRIPMTRLIPLPPLRVRYGVWQVDRVGR